MLSVKTFTFNPLQENTYLIYNKDVSSDCIVIDPGNSSYSEDLQLLDFFEKENLFPKKILCTHAHIDHIVGIGSLLAKYKNISLYMHPDDFTTYHSQESIASLFGFNSLTIYPVNYSITENEKLEVLNTQIHVLFTPGHAPGHVSFYIKDDNFLFSGDVIFKNGIGRTDLPGGNYDVLISSIKSKLFNLPNDTLIYPGHGTSTTIEEEKKHNPFLR